MSHSRCKDTHKFGNKYLPSAYKMQVDFRSHFSGKKVRLIVREIQYLGDQNKVDDKSRACGTYKGREKCIKGCNGEKFRIQTTCKT